MLEVFYLFIENNSRIDPLIEGPSPCNTTTWRSKSYLEDFTESVHCSKNVTSLSILKFSHAATQICILPLSLPRSIIYDMAK